MTTRNKEAKPAKADKPQIAAIVQSNCPPPEAVLEDAKKEPRKILLSEYLATIVTLRDEKKFTFRAIADWFAKRGIETDHSAIYRTYLANIPQRFRDPDMDWSEADEPGFGDENVNMKKA
ncbi:MAG TPA: hypothetical protein VGJ73_13485 [Verrucomicrobiae bacterium]|jgi:hypothetical protein